MVAGADREDKVILLEVCMSIKQISSAVFWMRHEELEVKQNLMETTFFSSTLSVPEPDVLFSFIFLPKHQLIFLAKIGECQILFAFGCLWQQFGALAPRLTFRPRQLKAQEVRSVSSCTLSIVEPLQTRHCVHERIFSCCKCWSFLGWKNEKTGFLPKVYLKDFQSSLPSHRDLSLCHCCSLDFSLFEELTSLYLP